MRDFETIDERLARGNSRYSLKNTVYNVEFDESKHPRDESGKFGTGGDGPEKETADSDVSDILEVSYKMGAKSFDTFFEKLKYGLSNHPEIQKSLLEKWGIDINLPPRERIERIKEAARDEYSRQRKQNITRKKDTEKAKRESFLEDITKMAEEQEKEFLKENSCKVYRVK
jgi:hypothetical protein